MHIGKLFASVLHQFCQERHLSSLEFSRQIGHPYSTVRKWMGGKAPKEPVARQVCAQIGVDFDALLGGTAAERMAESGLTLALLQDRYQHWIKTSPTTAQEIVGLAGVVAYNRTLRLGLRANLAITGQTMVVISADDQVSSANLALVVCGNGNCITVKLQPMPPSQEPALLSDELNETTLKDAVIRLMQ